MTLLDEFGNALESASAAALHAQVCDRNGRVLLDSLAKKSRSGDGNVLLQISAGPSANALSMTYMLARCGEYSISLRLEGVPVLGSPFALKVASARPSLARCSAEGLGLSTARVGDAAQFVVTLRNGDGHEIWLDTATTPEGTWMDKAGGYDPLSVRIESFDGHRATATIHECTDQVGYAVSYQVVRSGTWKIDVQLFGEPIPGSPFELPIEAGDVCAEACRASGDGLTASEAGAESSFVIQPMDRNGNLAGPMPAQLFRVVALLIQPVSPADVHHVRRPIDLAVHAESHGAPRSQCAAPTCHICTGICPHLHRDLPSSGAFVAPFLRSARGVALSR